MVQRGNGARVEWCLVTGGGSFWKYVPDPGNAPCKVAIIPLPVFAPGPESEYAETQVEDKPDKDKQSDIGWMLHQAPGKDKTTTQT